MQYRRKFHQAGPSLPGDGEIPDCPHRWAEAGGLPHAALQLRLRVAGGQLCLQHPPVDAVPLLPAGAVDGHPVRLLPQGQLEPLPHCLLSRALHQLSIHQQEPARLHIKGGHTPDLRRRLGWNGLRDHRKEHCHLSHLTSIGPI